MAFQFKQFSVNDDRSSMKVGTDAVLLGAWANYEKATKILDIGSGSGLISLMAAQRFYKAKITAIDIHGASIVQAKENFGISPWAERLNAIHTSLQELAERSEDKYDLILSNPPFFSDSLLPPDPSKKIAKHTENLSFTELCKGVSKLLDPSGRFYLILPYLAMGLFEAEAKKCGLNKGKELRIIPKAGKKINRSISEWSQLQLSPCINELTIRKNQSEYSKEYIKLTEAFYLAL